uniref:Nuclear receptor domain-containing protein n=1 Tax=Glossina morsitans morsitans TaxID=37546 RepID=A0A1B0FDX7_GLOMM
MVITITLITTTTTAVLKLNNLMNQTCKVCGEPAAGFHFGAFTCEGCKNQVLLLGYHANDDHNYNNHNHYHDDDDDAVENWKQYYNTYMERIDM